MDNIFVIQVAGLTFVTYLAFASMWLQYLAIMNLKENRSKLTVAAKIWAYPMLWIGLLSDALFNSVIGTVVYAELPREILFTSRCNRHLVETGWRGSVARWFCRNFMDPFDPAGRHCNGNST